MVVLGIPRFIYIILTQKFFSSKAILVKAPSSMNSHLQCPQQGKHRNYPGFHQPIVFEHICFQSLSQSYNALAIVKETLICVAFPLSSLDLPYTSPASL